MKGVLFTVLSGAAMTGSLLMAAAAPQAQRPILVAMDIATNREPDGWRKVSDEEGRTYMAPYFGNTYTYDNSGALGREWWNPDGSVWQMRTEFDIVRNKWKVVGDQGVWIVQTKDGVLEACKIRSHFTPPANSQGNAGARRTGLGGNCSYKAHPAGDTWRTQMPSAANPEGSGERFTVYPGHEPMPNERIEPTDGPWWRRNVFMNP